MDSWLAEEDEATAEEPDDIIEIPKAEEPEDEGDDNEPPADS